MKGHHGGDPDLSKLVLARDSQWNKLLLKCMVFICFHMGTRFTKTVEFPCALIDRTIRASHQIADFRFQRTSQISTRRSISLAARGLEEHNTVNDVTSLLHCGTVT